MLTMKHIKKWMVIFVMLSLTFFLGADYIFPTENKTACFDFALSLGDVCKLEERLSLRSLNFGVFGDQECQKIQGNELHQNFDQRTKCCRYHPEDCIDSVPLPTASLTRLGDYIKFVDQCSRQSHTHCDSRSVFNNGLIQHMKVSACDGQQLSYVSVTYGCVPVPQIVHFVGNQTLSDSRLSVIHENTDGSALGSTCLLYTVDCNTPGRGIQVGVLNVLVKDKCSVIFKDSVQEVNMSCTDPVVYNGSLFTTSDNFLSVTLDFDVANISSPHQLFWLEVEALDRSNITVACGSSAPEEDTIKCTTTSTTTTTTTTPIPIATTIKATSTSTPSSPIIHSSLIPHSAENVLTTLKKEQTSSPQKNENGSSSTNEPDSSTRLLTTAQPTSQQPLVSPLWGGIIGGALILTVIFIVIFIVVYMKKCKERNHKSETGSFYDNGNEMQMSQELGSERHDGRPNPGYEDVRGMAIADDLKLKSMRTGRAEANDDVYTCDRDSDDYDHLVRKGFESAIRSREEQPVLPVLHTSPNFQLRKNQWVLGNEFNFELPPENELDTHDKKAESDDEPQEEQRISDLYAKVKK